MSAPGRKRRLPRCSARDRGSVWTVCDRHVGHTGVHRSAGGVEWYAERPDRSATLYVRCSPEQLKRWTDAARGAGVPVAEWVRRTLDER